MLQSLQLTKRHALTPTLPNTYNFFDMLPIPYPQPLPSYTTFSPFSNTLLFCGGRVWKLKKCLYLCLRTEKLKLI